LVDVANSAFVDVVVDVVVVVEVVLGFFRGG
jgi:hypothetical protein